MSNVVQQHGLQVTTTTSATQHPDKHSSTLYFLDENNPIQFPRTVLAI